MSEDDHYAPGSFGCHEALHTASIIMDMIDERLSQHPAIVGRPDWRVKADAAHQALFDLY